MTTTTYFMCQFCGHCMSGSNPPDICPHCNKKCSFRDVTCYRPECGGPGGIDPLLAAQCGGLTYNS
jgi:hypothetical protein